MCNGSHGTSRCHGSVGTCELGPKWCPVPFSGTFFYGPTRFISALRPLRLTDAGAIVQPEAAPLGWQRGVGQVDNRRGIPESQKIESVGRLRLEETAKRAITHHLQKSPRQMRGTR